MPRPGLGESAVAHELRVTKNELKEHQLEIIGLKDRLAGAELVSGTVPDVGLLLLLFV